MEKTIFDYIEEGLAVVCYAGAIASLIAGFFGKPQCFITALFFAAPALALSAEIRRRKKEDKKA